MRRFCNGNTAILQRRGGASHGSAARARRGKLKLMAAREEETGSAGRPQGAEGRGRSALARYATRRPGVLIGSLVSGFAVGVGYRFVFNAVAERTLPDFLRSGVHGMGLGVAI